jgi:hypothetical protein
VPAASAEPCNLVSAERCRGLCAGADYVLLHDASKEMNATSKQMRMIFSMSPIVNNARNLNSKNGVTTLVALFGAVACGYSGACASLSS